MPSIITSSCLNLSTSSTVLKAASRFSLHTLSPRSWAVSFARTSILAVLDNAITIGHLTISDSEGTHYYGKYQKGCNDVHLNVINDTFWLRILLSGDLGFSEAYMIGDVEASLWLENESGMAETLSSTVAKVSSAISGLYNSFLGQTRSQARLNAIASYDQSNELFKAFLSKAVMLVTWAR
ncbi:hypothetical protein K443DRAFT_12347 [Laccaria amethystina LaAM-08-1]|uniref:Uncharacterized protein n=1 Tax=Laccaria amethystina LaAM-08-1 TaxID=1095629 RepID=A0A0C9WYT1_9AGAR|nr:hypothetical protein K443DRAFT_12347 [Laccaria amethystina LaAM-08-1]